MNVEISLSGPPSTVEALARFLARLEGVIPTPVTRPKVIVGEDRVIYVKTEFASEQEADRKSVV